MTEQKKAANLEKIVKIKLKVDELVKNKFKVSYRHSNSTNTYYIILSNGDGVHYNLRFSDHKSKDKRMKTFYFGNDNQKDLKAFIEKGIRAMELKQVRNLFKNLAWNKRSYIIAI